MRHQSFTRLAVVLLILVSGILVISCSGGGGSKITISTLTLEPGKLALEQTVVVGANVLNSGKKAEEYSAVLKINDSVVETKQMTVAAGETQTLSFQYTPKTTGSFRVDVNGQTGSFEVVKPAAFMADSLTVSPAAPVSGDELTASIKIQNTGDLSGDYSAVFKVDGKEVKTTAVTLEAGGSQTLTFPFTVDTAGNHSVEVAGKSQEFKVLKPADLKGTAVSISSLSVMPGEALTIEASIANEGEVKATQDIILMLNGNASGSMSLTLEAGASGKVSYTYTTDKSGTFSVNVLGATGSFMVIELSKYTSKGFFYSISYPPEFSVDEEVPRSVVIEKTSVGGISVGVENTAVALGLKGYLDQVIQSKKDLISDWTQIAQNEMNTSSGDRVYRFDYSYSKDGKKWLGKGMVIKNAGIGYYVGFSTTETDWVKYKVIAVKCLDSFVPPRSFSGSYSSSSLGLSLTLPEEWSVTETGATGNPLFFFSPSNQNLITGGVSVETVASGTTAKKYIEGALERAISLGWVFGTGSDFSFANGAIGYERPMSGTLETRVTYIYKFYCQVKDGRAVMLLYFAPSNDINAQTSVISQMARSLVVSKPGGIEGVDRNDAVFFPEGEIVTLDPALVETGPGDIIGALFSGLVRTDTNLKIAGDLAESWKVSDDGKVYTFYLRKNAKFHDGKPVTAADFKYSWERACDPLLKSPKAKSFLADIVGAKERMAGTSAAISGIKVVDDYTLEVTIDGAKPYFLGELAQPVAFVVDKADVVRGAQWYEKPNGSGPFKMKTWQKDTLMVLERNDNFYLTPAKVKNLVFKLFAGNTMQLYENGQIDLAPVYLTDQDKVLDSTNALNKELVTGLRYNVSYIGFNVTKPPFDDIKIRQALAAALDVSKLIEVSLKGRAEKASGFVPPGVPGNNPDLQPMAFNLDKAKQLIKESKYGSADKVPAITLYVVYGVTPTQQAIVGMWQALGLNVSTQVVSDIDDYLARGHRKEFQTWDSSWTADYIDPQNFLDVFFQSQSPENGFGYNNPEVDAALLKAGVEQNESARLKMYQDIEKMVVNDLPGVPLWWKMKTYILVKPYVKGYQSFPIDVNIWRELSIVPH